MPKFPQSFIDEVRAAADIVAVIQDYVSLRKAGASYKGLCPFHSEKSPSFTVNRDKGFFHCFGCNVGGDVFKFVELQEKLGFQDTVKHVAGKFGIPIPEMEAGEGQTESAAEREALLKMHDIAAAHFAEQLASPAGARYREYLQRDRGLTTATVAALKLGWAPPVRDGLYKRLKAQGFAEGLIRQSGLVSVRDDGTVQDRFRNRLMVPIARDSGSIVAFGGRALEPDQVPKYLNSPETPIYTKSRTLYGLNLSKADLRKAGFAIVVEGYFDFAQLYQAGGLPVVATCGTALTTQQAQMLRRFRRRSSSTSTPTTPGRTPLRSSELLVEAGFDVNVVRSRQRRPRHLHADAGRDASGGNCASQPYLEFLLDRAPLHTVSHATKAREFLQQMLAVARADSRSGHARPVRRPAGSQGEGHRKRWCGSRSQSRRRRKTTLPVRTSPAATHLTGNRTRAVGFAHQTSPVLQTLQEADLEGLASRAGAPEACELARVTVRCCQMRLWASN
jgi:DNA primase